MNTSWQQFLTSQGAKFDEKNDIKTFGQPDLEHFMVKHGPIVSDLSKQALIKVTGEESFNFLQGQLSNDLKNITKNQAQLSAYCEPQGKVLALITVFKINGAFYLSFDETLKETILKRLTMFKMMAKVELEEVSKQLIQIGYAGEFADLDLQRDFTIKTKEIYQANTIESKEINDVTVIKVAGPYHNYRLFGSPSQMETVWQTLRSNGEAVGSADWSVLNIIAAQPTLNDKTSGQFIAQFINLDKIDAINFKKGCYPGQEIIARMHYRGKASKRMLRIYSKANIELKAGNEIKLQDEGNRNYKFIIINSAAEIYEGTVFLAVTTIKALENLTGDLKNEHGDIFSIEPMPYDLTEN
jgi:folate-binding protein YgfZ